MIWEIIDVLLNNNVDVIDIHNLSISFNCNTKHMYISYVIEDIKQCQTKKQNLDNSKKHILQKIKKLWFDWPYPTQPPDDFFDETYEHDCIIDEISYIEKRLTKLNNILQKTT
jgi:hypothetical protein